MSAPASKKIRARTTASTYVWVFALGTGALMLTASLVRQRFVPIEQADPAQFPRAHRVWCTGELLSLRVELEEAMLQELTGHGARPELTRAEQVRRRTWGERLKSVSGRCQHSDLAQNGALGLEELAGRFVAVVDELHTLRTGLAAAVDNTLSHLKND